MKVQTMFCSACDRDVRVVFTAEPLYDGHAPLPDVEFVCLEIGEQCTGALCPLCALPPDALEERLVRSGLDEGRLRHITAMCPSCGRETDLVLVRRGIARCSECGSRNRIAVKPAETG
jgi:DNA-directed RNA polymerase subunit RPC12/RpoP